MTDIPHGPNEVLFLRPTVPGTLTPATFENALALVRCRNAWYVECCEAQTVVGIYGRLTQAFRRRDGSPSWVGFFNANLDRWYASPSRPDQLSHDARIREIAGRLRTAYDPSRTITGIQQPADKLSAEK